MFNDIVSKSGCIVRKNGCWWVMKSRECGTKRSWPNLRYNPALAWIDWGRNMERPVKERLCLGWILKKLPREQVRSPAVWVNLTGECVCGRIYLLRPSFFWDVTRRRSVAAYRRFGQPKDTNFKGLPSRIDILFFLLFRYSTNLFFLFPLLHSLILRLLYPPVYLHSSSVPPACSFFFYAAFSSFLCLILYSGSAYTRIPHHQQTIPLHNISTPQVSLHNTTSTR